MKTMQKRISAIALSALLATAAGGAMAFGGSHEHHRNCDRSDMRAPMSRNPLAGLEGLSDEQKTQLKQIRRETRDAMNDIRDEMRDVKNALRDAMADNAELDNIQALAKKQGEQLAKMIVLRAETRDKMKSVLTDEQRAQFDAMRPSGDGFGKHHDRMRF